MYVTLWVLIFAACALADNPNRRTKLPYIADAVGNSLPPPSSVPATVGSPVNLLTPDRYEFYTFDESGELVKRLMTLEEIQAIVAAGEETDGLVTFANDNQPTIAFNFSQPSHTKVHSVVTNVQNVLKAQMEAHKNKPNIQPTFDTPDVSDSWSLILPSIFGNTGMDIVPDKTSDSFITPETETIDVDLNTEYENSQSKESNEIPTISTSIQENKNESIPVKVLDEVSSSTTTTTKRPFVSSTTRKVSTIKTTTTTTETVSTTTNNPKTTTNRHKLSVSTSTVRPITTTILKITTNKVFSKPISEETIILNVKNENPNNNSLENKLFLTSTISPVYYEKISTFTPNLSGMYTTEKTTKLSNIEQLDNSVKSNNNSSSTLLNTPHPLTSVNTEKEYEKNISSTITTQSVSPTITASSTEFMPIQNNKIHNNVKNTQTFAEGNYDKDSPTSIPLFDVAQSISQIASDLGNNFAPVPTSNSLLETTKINNMDMESKENTEIEIPTEIGNENGVKANLSSEHFVQISTSDLHTNNENKLYNENKKEEEEALDINEEQTTYLPLSTIAQLPTTNNNIMDPILTGSMDDLLSQVVYEGPDSTAIIFSENVSKPDETDLKSKTDTNLADASLSSESTTSNVLLSSTTISLPLKYSFSLNKTKDENEESTKGNNNNNNVSYKVNDVLEIPMKKNVTNNKNSVDVEQHISNNVKNRTISLNKTTNHINNNNLEDKKKINLYSILNGSSELSNSNDKIESSTLENLNIKKSDVTLSLPDIITSQQSIKSSNKLHKLSEEQPKFDEFKKKIQKVNIDEKELANERNNSWKLIPTVTPPKLNEVTRDKNKLQGFYTPESNDYKDIILEFPKENQGLEVTTKDLGIDVQEFSELCNELAFKYWKAVNENINKKRSIVFSPYSITSMLAMMFMGAKGATSGEMNEVLKLDDMVTFNPHFTLKNISDSIEITSSSGVAVSAFIRELFSERNKGKILTFYKERAQHFYNGHVEEINFKLISDIIRRRTNLLVKRYTWGKIAEYMKTNNIIMHPPLAAFTANLFYTDCTGTSVDGRDGEMYFVVSPNIRQRRLVPVPAVVYKSNFLAGYDPVLDATAAALGNTNSIVTTLFLMPGQQGNVVHADDLENLEIRLLDSDGGTRAWNKLLRTLLPRNGLELQIPRFSHKSIFNISSTLQTMGMKELFDAEHADLGGMNGPSKDLYLSDMIQLTSFVTCGEGVVADQHHIEEYPESLDLSQKQRTSRWLNGWDEPRDYQRAFHDPHDVGEALHLPLHLRPRQARLPARNSQQARLKFDRPFLFFVRHNPSGMILYVGRYNPRLLP